MDDKDGGSACFFFQQMVNCAPAPVYICIPCTLVTLCPIRPIHSAMALNSESEPNYEYVLPSRGLGV